MTPPERKKLYTLQWYLTHKPGDVAAMSRVVDDLLGKSAPKQPNAPPKKPTKPKKPTTGPKVALVVGHNSKAPGAYILGGMSEYVFNNQVADAMISAGGDRFKRFNRIYGGGYRHEIDNVYWKVNQWQPDLVLELHFNGGKGDYTTVLAARSSTKSQALAEDLADRLGDALGIPSKGVMPRSRSQRGGRSLYSARASCLLTEPFFGDNPKHAKQAKKLGPRGMAAIYLKALGEMGY